MEQIQRSLGRIEGKLDAALKTQEDTRRRVTSLERGATRLKVAMGVVWASVVGVGGKMMGGL